MKAGNKNWYNEGQTELKQIFKYDTFIDKGKNATVPKDYTRIQVPFFTQSNMMDDIMLDW